MKYWILTFFALGLFACQSSSNTEIEWENIDMESRPQTVAADTTKGGQNVGETENTEDLQPESEGDPNDFYARIPKEKDQVELDALNGARMASEDAQVSFFSTMRVKEWMAGLEEKEDEYGMPLLETLSDNQFRQLTVKEHIYYHLAYPEEWSQNCAEMFFAAGNVQAISRYLPFADDGYFLSDRQTKYMENNRDSVSHWIKAFLKNQKAVTVEMLNLISDLKLKSTVPDLIRIFREQTPEDDLILTALIQMMDQAQYPTWTQSKLAKEDWDNEFQVIELNEVNRDMVLMYAEKFGKEK